MSIKYATKGMEIWNGKLLLLIKLIELLLNAIIL